MPETQGRILVADDEALNRILLKTSLEEQGHSVETASDGREALEMLAEGEFDVVLLDLLMPEVDGYQVLTEMKRTPSLRQIAVIVISALDDMESIVRCIEAGATDYLAKPFDPVLLRARLNASLAEKRLHDLQRAHTAEIEVLAEQLKVRNRFIKETFGRYLSDEIVAALLETPKGLELGGEKRKVTILMSDIRGFSAIAERLAPEQVVRIVNNYLGTMADVILEHQGTIDEFIGDSVLGLFGAPVARPDDAARAVRCALAMQKGMACVNATNREQGLPEVEMGIAVHTGDVVVGNIGSAKRTKYGAVGSHVNLAARIESFTVGGQILISEAVLREAAGDVVVGEAISVKAKGFLDPIRAHDLLGMGGADPLFLERPEDRLVRCEPPIPVSVTAVDGKHMGDRETPGTLVKASRRRGGIRTEAGLVPLDSLRLLLYDSQGRRVPGEVYGKVLPPGSDDGVWNLRFTSLPPEALELIQSRLAAES